MDKLRTGCSSLIAEFHRPCSRA